MNTKNIMFEELHNNIEIGDIVSWDSIYPMENRNLGFVMKAIEHKIANRYFIDYKIVTIPFGKSMIISAYDISLNDSYKTIK